MATRIEQQVALDEALVPSTKRLMIGKSNFRLPSDIQSKESTLQVIYDVLRNCLFFKAFLVTADVPEIYMQEFWPTVYVHQHSIRFKLDNKKHIVDLETFRDMLHICPRIPGKSFDELPFEAEIWSFLDIRNTKDYKEYYAYASREAAPKPKASARRERGGSDSSTTPPTAVASPRPIIADTLKLTAAEKVKKPAKAKKTDTQEQDRHDDEGDEKDESDDGQKDDDDKNDDDDDDNDEEEISKIDVHDDTERGRDDDEESKNNMESDDEETREEENFDPILRTPEDSEDNGNGEEDQGLRISKEERIHEEEEADELYRHVDINQGRGLQVSQDIEDSHVTLTPVHPDGQQESSSVSSQFMTSMLNPTSDV
nr:hypothetical protein [Tanacetum cinerariifolium]